MKGFYSLVEYYARDLNAYYDAIAVGPSHNYYEGRAQADITAWIEYFCVGMADAFEAVRKQTREEAKGGKKDQSLLLRQLDSRQRQVLTLFQISEKITANQVGDLLALKPRTARELCLKWVDSDFLVVSDPAKKSRRYEIGSKYAVLVKLSK